MLLDEQGEYSEADLQGELRPSFVISRMSELVPLLQQHFELQPPPHAETVVQEATVA